MLGAEIAICSANPLSTQDDVAAFLYSEGIRIFAWRGQSERQYRECIKRVLQSRPDILTDDGGDLHIAAHKLGTTRFYGGTEENHYRCEEVRDITINETPEISCDSGE